MAQICFLDFIHGDAAITADGHLDHFTSHLQSDHASWANDPHHATLPNPSPGHPSVRSADPGRYQGQKAHISDGVAGISLIVTT